MARHRALSTEQVDAYLQRIGVREDPSVSREWLERLHAKHLYHVPFENLDLHLGEPVRLEVEALYDKVVTRRRGGFCYELNGLFAVLLTALDFEVSLVSSRVRMPDGELSAPFDHLALIVELADGRWLVDVGFGDAFTTPRPLGATWTEPGRRLRTVETHPGWRLEKDTGEGWTPVYRLQLTPRELSEFLPRSRWHETSPDSPFQRMVLTSRATPSGRVTVTADRLVVTDHGDRVERSLTAEDARREALRDHFGAHIVDVFQRAARRWQQTAGRRSAEEAEAVS